jgi:pyridoxamine 5'-phosphate oxidase family protein
MPLDDARVRYLTGHHQGRLATVAPDGTPQNKPVGYHYNPELGTIDIAGFSMDTSAKYRNIATSPSVAFVVDDAIGEGASGMRFVEVRGHAEQAIVSSLSEEGLSPHIIRIHPRRVVSWNVDPEHPGLQTHTIVG